MRWLRYLKEKMNNLTFEKVQKEFEKVQKDFDALDEKSKEEFINEFSKPTSRD